MAATWAEVDGWRHHAARCGNLKVMKNTPFTETLIVGIAVVLTSCGIFDKKAPTKGNFKRAIQASIEGKPRCFEAEVPKDVPAWLGKLRLDENLEPLVAAGLVQRSNAQVPESQNPFAVSFGKKEAPKIVPGFHYDLTDLGKKVSRPVEARVAMFGASANERQFCYATPRVDEVVRYTEPSNVMGITVTEVTYTYHLADFADWATAPALAQKKFLQHALSLRDHPEEAQKTLILTSDGWRDHP
jgi:hypothetical protein